MILCEDLVQRLNATYSNRKGISEYYPHITVCVSCGLLFNPNSFCVKTYSRVHISRNLTESGLFSMCGFSQFKDDLFILAKVLFLLGIRSE